MRRPRGARSALAGTCGLVLAAGLVVPPTAVAESPTTVTAVAYGAAGWRYVVVATPLSGSPLGTDPGDPTFAAPGFDDSAWPVGTAPFGNNIGVCGTMQGAVTPWPASTDVLVRRHVVLPRGATNVRITGSVDNDAAVYVNGGLVGVNRAGNCWTDTVDMTVPADLLNAGDNVVAVRAHDYGVLTYLDVQITYDVAATRSPQEQLAALREAVADLGAGPGLLRLLDGVQAKLAAGSTAAAAHHLDAFAHHVRAQGDKQLTAEQAAALLAAAEDLRAALAA